MQKVSRQIFTELSWLILSLGLTTLLVYFLFGWPFSQNTIDIHLHDTFFIFYSWHILIPLFSLMTLIVYFIKEFRKSFSRTHPNWLLIIAGLVLVMSMTFLIKTFTQSFSGSLALNPPLSASPTDNISGRTEYPALKFITTFFTIIQIASILVILFVAHRWGTQTRKTSKE